MDEAKKILKKIFTITEAETGIDSAVDLFLAMVFEDAVYTLIQKLPQAKRESIARKWDANVKNTAALKSLLKHNFTDEQIDIATQDAAHKAIFHYLDKRVDSFTSEQKEKARAIAEAFVPMEDRPIKKGGSLVRKFVR